MASRNTPFVSKKRKKIDQYACDVVRCRLFPVSTLTAAAVRRKCVIPKARALFILVAFLKRPKGVDDAGSKV
jgi:hypothetical protein